MLLSVGLLVVAGVYLYSRIEKTPPDEEDVSPDRVEPRLDGEDVAGEPFIINEAAPAGDDSVAQEDDSSASASDTPQKIVTVRIVAREKKSFAGDELILSMRGIGLRHGKFGIFHRYDGSDESKTIFSAASLIEPGSFDLQNIQGQEIPGISLFLVLPGPIESVEAFDMMLAAARTLTQSLSGELLDESGSTLSIQRERYLREEVIQYQHSNPAS